MRTFPRILVFAALLLSFSCGDHGEPKPAFAARAVSPTPDSTHSPIFKVSISELKKFGSLTANALADLQSDNVLFVIMDSIGKRPGSYEYALISTGRSKPGVEVLLIHDDGFVREKIEKAGPGRVILKKLKSGESMRSALDKLLLSAGTADRKRMREMKSAEE